MNNIKFFICLFTLAFIACEKDENPYLLPPKPYNALRQLQVDMGENYTTQNFINLFDSSIVKALTDNSGWDLAFECGEDGYRIYQNGGKGILIAVIGKTNYAKNIDFNALNWRYDAPGGGDSAVLNNWCNANRISNDSVYLIDVGSESPIRYYQFKILSVTNLLYKIEIADINGNFITKTAVPKNKLKNAVYYHFNSNKVLDLEPNKTDWHFNFLRYRFIYNEFNPPLQYIVTGIFINPELIAVCVDSNVQYKDIDINFAKSKTYTKQQDAMGFDWKVYNFNTGRYVARSYVNYIIKVFGQTDTYYKIRFTGFYSSTGVKGSPKFEILKIE